MLRHSFEYSYHSLNKVLIDKKALRHNLKLFKKLVPHQAICPVLKSNAYGHGLVNVAKILESENPPFFMVDSLYEGYELREAGIHTPILVMGYTLPENLKRPHSSFHFAVFDLASAKTLAKIKAPVHLKIETGLNRMGFTVEELKKVLPKLQKMKLNIEGVFTHLADADNPISNAYTEHQLKKFREALGILKNGKITPKWVHVAASAGALKAEIPEANMVRLGLGLYGINPYQKKDPYYKKLIGLKPTLELQCKLTAIRKIKKGAKVSYGGSFVAPKDMTIGIVPTGYFEALPRGLSSKGYVEIRKKMCPILGRVCMNYIVIDVSKVKAKLQDTVILYSRDNKKLNSITNVATLSGTIPNEILVRIAEGLLRIEI